MLPLMIAALSLSQHHYANAENSTPKSWADDNESKEYIDQRSLIIGGDEVSEGAYSYVVSLKDQSGHFCGGSLIAPDVVLTAAHCIFLDDMEYNVTIGRRDLDDVSVGEEISVKEDLPYPNYDMMKSDDFDCGLILLTRAANVTLEDLVKLNSNKSAPIPGETVSFAGWGDTTSDDEIDVGSSVLRQVETIVIPNEECENSEGNHGGFDQSYNGVITDNMLCTFSEDKDSCQRDSGGPLVIRGANADGSDDIQVGVVSWGIGCATNQFPGVSARVSSVYNDIREFVCAKSATPPLDFQCQELGFNTEVVDTKTPTSNPTILPSSLSEIDPNLFVDTEVMETSKPTSNPTIVPPSLSEIDPSQLPTTKSNEQTVPLQTSSTSTNIAKTSLTSVSLAFVLSFF